MSIERADIIRLWNEQADEYNQWSELDADERVEFTLSQVASEVERLRELIVQIEMRNECAGQYKEIAGLCKAALRGE